MDKSVATAPKEPSVRTIKKVRIGRNTYSRAEIWVGVLLLVPSIVFLVFTFVIPVVQVIELSLTNFNMATGEMSFVGVRNYEYLLGNDRFWLAMWNTCKYSAAKLIFDTSLALFIAVQLDKNVPLKKFLRSTYFAPVVVPMVASSLIWIWFYDPQVGPSPFTVSISFTRVLSTTSFFRPSASSPSARGAAGSTSTDASITMASNHANQVFFMVVPPVFLFCFMGPRSPSDRRATLRIYTPSLYRHGGLLSSFISQYSQMTNRKQGRPRKYMIFCRFFKLQEIMQFGDAQMCK